MHPSTTTPTFFYSPLAADPDLVDIVQEFVEALGSRLDDFEAAFAQQNWGRLAQLAHQLKGAAGSYGFGDLSHEMGLLEATLALGQPAAVADKLSEVRHMISFVRWDPPPAA